MSDNAALIVMGALAALTSHQRAQQQAHQRALKAKKQQRAEEEEAAQEEEWGRFCDTLASVVAFGGLYQQATIPSHMLDRWDEAIPAKLDAWCRSCEKVRPFRKQDQPAELSERRAPLVYRCLDCEDVEHECILKLVGEPLAVVKIGQFPPLADTLASELVRYKEQLPRSQMRALRRGIGLRSHGIGAGSFVYLRRIIEELRNLSMTLRHLVQLITESHRGSDCRLQTAD